MALRVNSLRGPNRTLLDVKQTSGEAIDCVGPTRLTPQRTSALLTGCKMPTIPAD